MKFKLTVTYQAGNTQVHDDLDANQAEQGTGAFARDLIGLEGGGVKSVLLELDEAHS